MYDIVGFLVQGFIYLWITIIATLPQIFMGGLTLCVVATVATYFTKKDSSQS